MQPLEWLWQDRIPLCSLTLLEGLPGHGKTAVSLDLAACVSTGASIPFRSRCAKPAGVVILQCEDNHDTTLVPNLRAAGANLDRINLIERVTLPDDITEVEDAIQEVSAKLVVIDPIADFFGISISSQQVNDVLLALEVVANKHKLAVLLIRHLTKATNSPYEYLGAGSHSIIGKARSGLRVEDHPNEQPFHHALVQFKRNLAAAIAQPYRTVRHATGAITVEWLRVDQNSAQLHPGLPQKSQIEEATDFLFEVLGDGPVKSTEVLRLAKENDLAEKTVRNAKRRAGIRHFKKSDGKKIATLWELPHMSPDHTSEVAMVLAELLKESCVVGVGEHPKVILNKDNIVVVRRHLDGGDSIRVQSEIAPDGQAVNVTAEAGERTERLVSNHPEMFKLFREKMKRFNLEWQNDVFESLVE